MIDFLTHPHHRHTRSYEPVQAAIGRPVRKLYGDPETLREYLPSLQANPPRLLILWQLEHLAAWASHFCPVLVFPMHDLTRLTPDSYLASLRNVEWISFSRALHQRLSGLGLSSHYLQYAPDPAGFPQASWDQGAKAYFWERMPAELDERAVRRILAGLGVDSLEVRRLGDAQFSSEDPRDREQAERSWKAKEAYLQTLRRFNVYMAPRRHEGIGLAFLEAMAMGMCVVAENQPTANEYILSGHNGILYGGDEERLYAPRKFELADLQRMGLEARKSLGQIHQAWLRGRGEIGETVERMLERQILQQYSPTKKMLEATFNYACRPESLLGEIGSFRVFPVVWRSKKVEQKMRSRRGLIGWIRWFFRNPRECMLRLLRK